MSKSVGNTVSPREMLAQAPADVVRYFLGQAHYRSQLDYSPSSLAEAGAALERVKGFVARAAEKFGADAVAGGEVASAFAQAMDDDLNVPQALAALHETVRRGNAALGSGDGTEAGAALDAARQVAAMTAVLGLDDAASTVASSQGAESDALAQLVEARLAERAAARAAKDFETSDRIRDELAAVGITVKDGADGASWFYGN